MQACAIRPRIPLTSSQVRKARLASFVSEARSRRLIYAFNTSISQMGFDIYTRHAPRYTFTCLHIAEGSKTGAHVVDKLEHTEKDTCPEGRNIRWYRLRQRA